MGDAFCLSQLSNEHGDILNGEIMKKGLYYWIVLLLNVAVLFIMAWNGDLFSVISFLMAFNIIIVFVWRSAMVLEWKNMAMASGKDVDVISDSHYMVKYLTESSQFMQQVRFALGNLDQIGNQEFSNLISSIANEEVKMPLLSANRKIMEMREKEREGNRITHGISVINGIKHRGNNLAEYALLVITAVVKHLNANHGAFYLLKSDSEGEYFDLSATYAYGKKKFIEGRVGLGEGLVGQVYYEKEMVYMTNVPKDYIKITSGLGEALPRCVCIVPIMFEGVVYGAIEIASFNILVDSDKEYLRKISESIGYNLNAIATQEKTALLLENSKKMEKELKVRESELRLNVEVLASTQEQMQRKQDELDALLSSLSVIELNLDGVIRFANQVFLSATGHQLFEIENQHYNYLSHNEDSAQFDIMWSSILSGKIFSGEFKIVNRDKKEIWMAGNFTPILNKNGKPYKVIVITVFTTRDKEKMTELQELVTAFKSCMPVAEINEDLSFRSANDLFLNEMGIKRLELKKLLPKSVFSESSFIMIEKYLHNMESKPCSTVLDIINKNGSQKEFHSALFKLNNNGNLHKRGLLILKNMI